MEHQNITLSLPKEVLRRVKHIAIEKQTSVSGLLAKMLEEMVKKEDLYAEARKRHLEVLKAKLDLGTHGKATWRRGDLHER